MLRYHPQQARADRADADRHHDLRLRLRPPAARRSRSSPWPASTASRPSATQQLQEQFGYDQPIWQQYFDYVGDVLHGDFGISIATKRPVIERVPDAVPGDHRTRALRHDLRHRARHPGRHLRRGQARLAGSTRRLMGTALVGYSMPIFWWGLLLIIFFSGYARLDAGLGPHRPAATSSSRSPASC